MQGMQAPSHVRELRYHMRHGVPQRFFLKKKTKPAPNAVTAHVKIVANNAWIIGDKLKK